MNKQICNVCGEQAVTHKIKRASYSYRDHTFEIEQPALWCDSCGEGVISAADDKAVIAEIQANKSHIDGILAPKEVQKIRKQLKLTQKDASLLFGGGVNAFNRYEKGINPIPKPLSLLLMLLEKHPNQLQELVNHTR
jgi:HTH-type transcriptional regulator/antitoxin MqsA